MISCGQHLQIPPEGTTGCGARWYPFPTSETATTIRSCLVLLKHGKVWSLLKLRRGKISWVHPLKVSPKGLWRQTLGLAPTPSGLGGRRCCLVQWHLLWVSRPLAEQERLLFVNPSEEAGEGFEGAREQAEWSRLPLVPCWGRDEVRLLEPGLDKSSLSRLQAGARSPTS